MIVTRRPLFYGVCLLLGTLLFGGAGLMHPLLSGDGAAQLATIARTSGWRMIHWSLLFGLVFMYAGVHEHEPEEQRPMDHAPAARSRDGGELRGAIAREQRMHQTSSAKQQRAEQQADTVEQRPTRHDHGALI